MKTQPHVTNTQPANAQDNGNQATDPTPASHPAVAPPARQPKRRALAVSLAAAVILVLAAVAILNPHARAWLGLSSHDHAAADKKQLWTCGMHPQVIQDKPGTCPICQMKLEPLDMVQSGQSTMGKPAGERKIAYWWDPMLGAASISDKPGKSAMGMDLVPVYEDTLSGSIAIAIDPVVVQNMGVRVAPVTRGPIGREVRAVGFLDEAQPKVHDVNLRVSGWIEHLYADTVGQHLEKDAKLFDLYSPEIQVAVEELIAARKALDALGPRADDLARGTSKTLMDAARRKLELWGLDPKQVENLSHLDEVPRTVAFTSPITGHVTEKMVVSGSAVKAGDAAMRIVDHTTLWLDAQVYPQDLPFVSMDQPVAATVEGIPGATFPGKVIFIHPHVDPQTRTATIRMSLPNPDMRLRPGMYATATLPAKLADEAVLVPREAVIDTGVRQIAFLARGEGRFEPRQVRLGVQGADGMVQVLEGLAPGEMVVTSGQFLLDAESRMREAIQKHLNKGLLANAAPQAKPDAAAHQHPSSHPATAPAPSAAVDRVVAEYLAVQASLGTKEPASAGPLDLGALDSAAQRLANDLDADVRPLARAIQDAAAAMRDKPLAEQRKAFRPLSEALIALVEARPPSTAIGDAVHIASCPMALNDVGGRWLQRGTEIANPYYATQMKACGQIEQKVRQVSPAGTGGAKTQPATQHVH